MTAEAKAKYRAAEKARHKGQVLKTEEITTGATDPNAAGASKDKADDKLTYRELPEGTKLKYDKQLLVKKPKLKRRQYHHYDTRPLRPREASRENRRLRKHSKGKGSKGDRPQSIKDRDDALPPGQPTEARPTDEPTPAPPTKAPKVKEVKAAPEPKTKEPKAPKVKEEKAPKEKKAKKAPVPKPDPTLDRPDY